MEAGEREGEGGLCEEQLTGEVLKNWRIKNPQHGGEGL